jgi:D-tyrosyl-tRNA(Tyr) deacylase
MMLLLQRVKEAKVICNGKVISQIGKGILVFLGISKESEDAEVEYLAKKCVELRIFEDSEGKMNYSVKDVGGQVMVVSQFTLYAQTRRGRRPDFTDCAEREKALSFYERFINFLKDMGIEPACGLFGKKMEVHLVNDGPATFILQDKN